MEVRDKGDIAEKDMQNAMRQGLRTEPRGVPTGALKRGGKIQEGI